MTGRTTDGHCLSGLHLPERLSSASAAPDGSTMYPPAPTTGLPPAQPWHLGWRTGRLRSDPYRRTSRSTFPLPARWCCHWIFPTLPDGPARRARAALRKKSRESCTSSATTTCGTTRNILHCTTRIISAMPQRSISIPHGVITSRRLIRTGRKSIRIPPRRRRNSPRKAGTFPSPAKGCMSYAPRSDG